MRRLLLVIAAGLGLALGVGLATSGGSTGVPAGARVVPADVAAFVSVDGDLESAQWQRIAALVGGQDTLLGVLRSALAGKEKLDLDRDVLPALGPELDVVALDAQNAFALLQPRDEAALAALLAKAQRPVASARVGDWTVVAASSGVVDRARAALTGGGARLAGDAAFRDALAAQPADVLARAYVSGAGLRAAVSTLADGCDALVRADWAAGSAAATDGGVALQAQVRTDETPATAPFAPPFASQIPAGVIAYAGFSNVGARLTDLRSRCPSLFGRLDLGVPLPDLAALVSGDGAVYVRSGLFLPEVTLVLAAPDASKALATVDALAARAGRTAEATEIDGVAARRIAVGPLALVYAAFDGELVVSDDPGAISELRDTNASKLADDAAFRAARTAAGAPDATLGLVYVDVQRALPLLKMLGGLAGNKATGPATDFAAHVGTAVFWGAREGGRTTLHGFVTLR